MKCTDLTLRQNINLRQEKNSKFFKVISLIHSIFNVHLLSYKYTYYVHLLCYLGYMVNRIDYSLPLIPALMEYLNSSRSHSRENTLRTTFICIYEIEVQLIYNIFILGIQHKNHFYVIDSSANIARLNFCCFGNHDLLKSFLISFIIAQNYKCLSTGK